MKKGHGEMKTSNLYTTGARGEVIATPGLGDEEQVTQKINQSREGSSTGLSVSVKRF